MRLLTKVILGITAPMVAMVLGHSLAAQCTHPAHSCNAHGIPRDGECCVQDGEDARIIPCAPGQYKTATRDAVFPRERCGNLVVVVDGQCTGPLVGAGGDCAGDLAYGACGQAACPE